MAVLFFLVFHWVVLTRAVRICNQCKDLPTISTLHLLLSLRDYCPALLCQVNHFWVELSLSWNGTIFVLLALCAGNSPVTGEFPSQRPVMQSFDVFFDLRLNKRLSKQSWGWWFEMPSCSLWRHCNEILPSEASVASCCCDLSWLAAAQTRRKFKW